MISGNSDIDPKSIALRNPQVRAGAADAMWSGAAVYNGFAGTYNLGAWGVFANPSPASIRKVDTLTLAIFRVIYALDSQSSELHFSNFLSQRGDVVDECTFNTQSVEMCLFDAAYEGTEASKGDHIFFDLESGLHLATSSIVQPDGDTMLHIVLIQTIRSQ